MTEGLELSMASAGSTVRSVCLFPDARVGTRLLGPLVSGARTLSSTKVLLSCMNASCCWGWGYPDKILLVEQQC